MTDSSAGNGSTPAVSGPESTRAAILEAAATEFAERGFEGARIEHIAARAGFNKALIYRYFGGRDNLLREVLRLHLHRREGILAEAPDDLAEALVYWFERTVSATEFNHLLQREALNHRGTAPVEAEARAAYYAEQVRRLREWQRNGRLRDDLDARYLFLALLALIANPGNFPQVTRLVTGLEPSSDEFRRHWRRLLRQLAGLLRPDASGGT